MADLYTADLLGSVLRRSQRALPRVDEVGLPLWVHAEGHAIGLVLEDLLARLAGEHGVDRVTVEALMGDQRVYLDLTWRGRPVASETLDRWLDAPSRTWGRALRADPPGAAPHGRLEPAQRTRPGVRLSAHPLPASERQWQSPSHAPAVQHEFYDFSVAQQPPQLGEWAERALDQLSCVVFDTETTGLSPARGDEIIAIGAVRLVNGRVLQDEYFEQLVKPCRAIPDSATRFHGISNEDVARAPEIGPVLRAFSRFIGEESVLVAHNAAFDMGFLRRAQARAGLAFPSRCSIRYYCRCICTTIPRPHAGGRGREVGGRSPEAPQRTGRRAGHRRCLRPNDSPSA